MRYYLIVVSICIFPISASVQETWVQSLGWEDPLEKKMDGIFAWRMLWTEEPDGLQSMGSQRGGHD